MRKKGILSSLSGNSKIFLLICLASAFAADFTAFVFLTVGGADGKFWAFPLVFALVDAAFIAQAAFSNFRFKYTVGEIAGYIAVSLIVLAVMLWADVFPGGEVYFTRGAAALWFAMHLSGLIAALCCYLRAATFIRGRAGNVAAVALCALCIAGACFYGVTLAATGFLGQGPEIYVRTLAYDYDEESDGYEVKRVLSGKGTGITVPAEFNGKKITKVSAGIFTAEGVTDVTLDCSPDVEFSDAGFYSDGKLTLHVNRNDVDLFRESFFAINHFELANAVVPYGLKDDEVYVTFAYDSEALENAGGRFFPTYIGKKGAPFNLAYFKDIPYAKHTDRRADGDLYWSYTQNNGKILSPLTYTAADGQSVNLDGWAVTRSVSAAEVRFENVYRVYPINGGHYDTHINNDAKYNLAEHFGYSEAEGKKLDYKLTVAEYADEILNITRSGFTRDWYFASGDRTGQYRLFTSLKEEFERGLPLDSTFASPDYVTVSAHWELNAPTLSVASDHANGATYGDDVKLTATAVAPIPDARMEYYWEKTQDYGSPSQLGNAAEFSLNNIYPSEAGTYACTVSVYSDSTSLTSYKTGLATVAVNPRPLSLEWFFPQSDVYDGEYKTVSCEIADGGLINGDTVRLSYNGSSAGFNVRNAGSYPLTVRLAYEDGKYELDSTATRNYEIKKAPVTVAWQGTTRTYNGYGQAPYIATRGEVDGEVVRFSGSASVSDAGEHTVRRELATDSVSSNYYIAGCTSPLECGFTANSVTTKFIITPYEVDITWAVYNLPAGGTNAGFTYDGLSHTVNATAYGATGSTIQLDLSRTSVSDAGAYEITASCRSRNYTPKSGARHTITVAKRQVSYVMLESTNLTYNGYVQAPAAYIHGVGKDPSRIPATGTGAAKDAGSYDFLATTPSNENYEIVGADPLTYKIHPYVIRINWSETEVTYDGKPHLPKASATGVGGDGELEFEVERVGGDAPVEANNYTCRATVIDGASYYAKNYKIDSNYGNVNSLLIRRVTLTVKLNDVTVYAGQSFDDIKGRLTYTVTGFVNGETLADFNIGAISFTLKDNISGALSAGSYEMLIGTPSGTHDQPLVYSSYLMHFVGGTLTVRQ